VVSRTPVPMAAAVVIAVMVFPVVFIVPASILI
jgi:hypothetical protein